jgi:ferredoxin-NADP reductase
LLQISASFSFHFSLLEWRVALERELYTARLARKECISESAQCYHFNFEVEGQEDFAFTPGQFISVVAGDERGKQQTRAYSMASAPARNRFELCINRVEAGFFSNRLADLPVDADELLPVGGKIQFHGPHGNFTLHQPLTDSILIATGTGVAPMRGYLQWLFSASGPDRSEGHQVWLLFGTRHETELYFHEEFEEMARLHGNFHYMPTLSRPGDGWHGLRGYVQDHLPALIGDRTRKEGTLKAIDPEAASAAVQFDIHAYICGLNEMVASVRELLLKMEWNKKQIVYERYN